MTVLYSDNFDSHTAGALPSGWANKNGSWVVSATSPVSGANAFTAVSNSDGDAAICTAASAASDMAVDTRQTAVLRSGKYPIMGHLLRMDSGYANGYAIVITPVEAGSCTIYIFKRSAGGYSVVGNTTFSISLTAGDVIGLKSTINGAAISTKLWNATTGSEPGTASISATDSTHSAAGYAGFYYAIGGASGPIYVDDFVLSDVAAGDSTAPTLTSATATTTGATTANGSVTTDEANGTLYRYASTNATETVATVKASGATSTVTATGTQSVSFTGLTASTTYYAHYVHRDAAGNDSTVANSASFSTNAASATAVTMSGPASGTVGVASTNFTVGANGAITGTVVVTPSDSAGGGAFTPTSVSISSGTPTGTFTYTPGSVGAKTISVTNNGSLTNPSNITYTASAAENNAYIPSGILFSPYNWKSVSGYAKTINAGAYFKTIFGGTACTLKFDMTGIGAPVPQISYRIDGFGPWITTEVSASVVLTIPAKVADYAAKGGHLLEVIVKSTTETQNRWSPQSTAVVLTGVILDTGKSLTAPPSLPLRGLYFGDSITEGVRTVNATDANDTDRNDAAQGWAYQSAKMVGAECGNVGFGGQSYAGSGGGGGVPAIGSSFNFLWSGEARSFSPYPDYIVINEGANDSTTLTTAATAFFNSLISATTRVTKIFVMRPFSGNRASEIVSAIAACSDPSRIIYVDTTGWFTTANAADGLHPYGSENITHIAPLMAAVIRNAVAPQRGTRTLRSVTVNLVNASNAAQASLTGLKWAFYDQLTPDLMTVAADQGTAETTDGAGALTIPVYTTLSPGQVGWLVVTNSDGNPVTVHKAFSGPVTVA